MKTSKQNKKEKKNSEGKTSLVELQNRSDEQSSQTETAKAPENTLNTSTSPTGTTSATAPDENPKSEIVNRKSIRPYINYAERAFNRNLPAEKILAVLKRWMPREYGLAKVIGKWIWITFPEQPVERVRADLSQLGFHWNNTRKCWQHPCGTPAKSATARPADTTDADAANPHLYTGPARTAEQVAA